jgi:hypothetical protein
VSSTFHLLTGEYPPQQGGVGDYTAALAAALARRGCEVHVWAPAPATADRRGVTVHELPDRFGPRTRECSRSLPPQAAARSCMRRTRRRAWREPRVLPLHARCASVASTRARMSHERTYHRPSLRNGRRRAARDGGIAARQPVAPATETWNGICVRAPRGVTAARRSRRRTADADAAITRRRGR